MRRSGRLRALTLMLSAICAGNAAGAASSPLAPSVDRAVVQWLNIVSSARSRSVPELTAAVERELYRRSLLDQAVRVGLAQATARLNSDDRRAASTAIEPRLIAIDRDNLAYVKSVVPADGWFRRSRDGEIAATHAWLIVHHSDDWDFKRQVLQRMAPLLAAGEVRPSNFALLYDRIAQHDGRPQRYGSQFDCRDGRWRLYAVEDAEGLDARRAAVGLDPIAVYQRDIVGRSC